MITEAFFGRKFAFLCVVTKVGDYKLHMHTYMKPSAY